MAMPPGAFFFVWRDCDGYSRRLAKSWTEDSALAVEMVEDSSIERQSSCFKKFLKHVSFFLFREYSSSRQMISDFLFTPKQQRLLATLLLQPERRFTFAALQDKVPGGTGSLYQYVRSLVEAGVLTSTQVRGSKLYQANRAHPLYPELCNIAVKTFGVAEPIRDALKPFAADIERAFIFGSIVKGSDDHESDIDVMVVGRVSKGKLLQALQKTEKLTGRPVHANVYGIDEWPSATQDPVISAILEGPTLELHFSQGADNGDE
jgi:uncharacterized protein